MWIRLHILCFLKNIMVLVNFLFICLFLFLFLTQQRLGLSRKKEPWGVASLRVPAGMSSVGHSLLQDVVRGPSSTMNSTTLGQMALG